MATYAPSQIDPRRDHSAAHGWTAHGWRFPEHFLWHRMQLTMPGVSVEVYVICENLWILSLSADDPPRSRKGAIPMQRSRVAGALVAMLSFASLTASAQDDDLYIKVDIKGTLKTGVVAIG